MSIPITATGVGLSSQSNPIYAQMRELNNSIQNKDLLDTKTDDALREVTSILATPDVANGTSVAQSLMKLISTIDSTSGDSSEIAEKISGMLSQIQSFSGVGGGGGVGSGQGLSSSGISAIGKMLTSSSSTAAGATGKSANAMKEINQILRGGVENMQELRTLITLLDLNPSLISDELMAELSEAMKQFMCQEISECTRPDQVEQLLQDIQGVIASTQDDRLVTALAGIETDPDVQNAVQTRFPEETIGSILSGNAVTPTSDASGPLALDNTNTNPIWLDGISPQAAETAAEEGTTEDINPSLFTPTPLSVAQSKASPTNTVTASGLSIDSKVAAIKPAGLNIQATSSSNPNSNNSQNNSTQNPSLRQPQRQAPTDPSRDPLSKASIKSELAPTEKPSPKQPQEVKLELQSWGKDRSGIDTGKPMVAKTSGSKALFRDKMSKSTNDFSQNIAMGAQSTLNRKQLGLKDSTGSEMSDLLRKPKPNAQALAKAFDDDPAGVTEQLYFALMNIAHYRMEESINKIVPPSWAHVSNDKG